MDGREKPFFSASGWRDCRGLGPVAVLSPAKAGGGFSSETVMVTPLVNSRCGSRVPTLGYSLTSYLFSQPLQHFVTNSLH